MIVGIFCLLVIGCLMLLRSDEREKASRKKYHENIKLINETNRMLDDTLEELERYNQPLKKVCNYIDKFNRKILGIKYKNC